MIIKENDIIIIKTLAGKYGDCPNQAAFDEMKKVYDVDENGFSTGNVIHTKDYLSLEWEITDINWFAGQHIEASYPQWKQSNIIQAGGAELTKMTTFINAVRTWSNQDPLPNPWDGTLEAITP